MNILFSSCIFNTTQLGDYGDFVLFTIIFYLGNLFLRYNWSLLSNDRHSKIISIQTGRSNLENMEEPTCGQKQQLLDGHRMSDIYASQSMYTQGETEEVRDIE